MSGITQYPPPGATKSTQRGRTVSTGPTTDVTVSAVNPNKSRLTLLGWTNALDDIRYQPYIYLLNATTVRIFSAQAGDVGFFPTTSWELIEVY